MKNNILLIIAVTAISLAVIIGVVLISLTKKQNETPAESEVSSQSTTLSSTNISEPLPAVTSTEPLPDSPNEPTTEEPTDEPEVIAPEADAIITTAKLLLGTPFADNGDSPDGFDNSGFIYYVLRSNGYITCPRGVTAQSAMGTQIPYEKLKAGDLVFFSNEGQDGAGFGGIYIGGGKMIACLMPGTVVKEVDITTNYYRSNFYTGISLS